MKRGMEDVENPASRSRLSRLVTPVAKLLHFVAPTAPSPQHSKCNAAPFTLSSNELPDTPTRLRGGSERLVSPCIVKPYFRSRPFRSPGLAPGEEASLCVAFEDQVRKVFASQPNGFQPHVVTAARQVLTPSGRCKITLMASVLNCCVEYTRLPNAIAAAGCTASFDTSIYKPKEQLLDSFFDQRHVSDCIVQHLKGDEHAFCFLEDLFTETSPECMSSGSGNPSQETRNDPLGLLLPSDGDGHAHWALPQGHGPEPPLRTLSSLWNEAVLAEDEAALAQLASDKRRNTAGERAELSAPQVPPVGVLCTDMETEHVAPPPDAPWEQQAPWPSALPAAGVTRTQTQTSSHPQAPPQPRAECSASAAGTHPPEEGAGVFEPPLRSWSVLAALYNKAVDAEDAEALAQLDSDISRKRAGELAELRADRCAAFAHQETHRPQPELLPESGHEAEASQEPPSCLQAAPPHGDPAEMAAPRGAQHSEAEVPPEEALCADMETEYVEPPPDAPRDEQAPSPSAPPAAGATRHRETSSHPQVPPQPRAECSASAGFHPPEERGGAFKEHLSGERSQCPARLEKPPLLNALLPKFLELFRSAGEYGLLNIAKELLGGRIKVCGSKFYLFDEEKRLWKTGEKAIVGELLAKELLDVLHKIKDHHEAAITQATRQKDVEIMDQVLQAREHIKKLKTIKGTEALVNAAMRSKFGDDQFEQRMDGVTHLLGVSNGVIDLRTGQLRERQPGDFIRNALGVEDDPAADTGFMAELLLSFTAGSKPLAKYLQLLLGYGITAEAWEDVFVVFTGSDKSGREVLTQLLQDLMGDHFYRAPATNALIAGSKVTDADRRDLIGARIINWKELAAGEKLSTAKMTKLTGGGKISAQAAKKGATDVAKPRYLCILESKHTPELDMVDPKASSPLLCVHFPVEFTNLEPGEEPSDFRRQHDTSLKARLGEQLPGVLRWLVQGAVRYYAARDGGHRNLRTMAPPEVHDLTKSVLEQGDTLQEFLDACCETGPDLVVSSTELLHAHNRWILTPETDPVTGKPKQHKPLGADGLSAAMKGRGFKKKASRRATGAGTLNCYMGIRLLKHEAGRAGANGRADAEAKLPRPPRSADRVAGPSCPGTPPSAME